MALLIKENRDFMIESNLSKATDYDWIGAMRKQGYDTVLFFLGTENVEINKARVQQRVLEGGHDIAPSLIEHRYQVGLSYLKSKILEFTEAKLIDVSHEVPKEMAVLKMSEIIYKNPKVVIWVQKTLDLAERLQQKRRISEEKEINPKNHNKRG
jgi:predicted ABC-type ATPase